MRVHAEELNRTRELDLGQRLGEDAGPHVGGRRVFEGDRIDSCLDFDVVILCAHMFRESCDTIGYGNLDGPLYRR
jgi:hypothetical protein